MKEMNRERSFSWADPRTVVERIAGREHMEWMREMLDGEIPGPPAGSMLEMRAESIEPGHAVFTMPVEEWMANPAAVVHGGLTSTLLDTVLTLSVMSLLPRDKFCTTLHLNVHFVRSLQPNGERITADARAVHVGTTIGTAEGRVVDSRGRVVAHGTASLAIVDAVRPQRSPDT